MGNYSRNTFDRLKHYVSVRLQQGVPLVDADWNEMEDIRREEMRTFIRWFIGDGVPAGDNGFLVLAYAVNDLRIMPGRCFVDGREAVNDSLRNYTAQSLYNNPALATAWGVSVLPALTTPAAARTDTVYLDIWDREVPATEDSTLVNPAIGIETCVRLKQEWVVRVAEGATAPPTPVPPGHVYLRLATLIRAAGVGQISNVTDLRPTGISLGGGVVSGNLRVNGNVGINAEPAHRLFVAAGDEADGYTYGVVTNAATGSSTAGTMAISGSASSDGDGYVYGLDIDASGNGAGPKCAVTSSASGADGYKCAGNFFARTTSNASAAQTTAINAYADTSGSGHVDGLSVDCRGDGTGVKRGIYCRATGTDGPKYAAQFSASTSSTTSSAQTNAINAQTSGAGSGLVRGMYLTATGDGVGNKEGIMAYVSGADGNKYGGYFYANTSSSTSTVATTGIVASSSSAGNGTVSGLNVTASGNGSGDKTGISSSANGAAGRKYAGIFQASTTSATGSILTRGLNVDVQSANGGDSQGMWIDCYGTGSGRRWGIYARAFGTGGGDRYGIVASATGDGNTAYGIYASVSNTGAAYAGYFNGNVHVTGTISTWGTKPFLIDHPLDPYNKTLRHIAVESPEELCLYRGKVALDGSGNATVTMPEYFAALTTEEGATVCLTPIGRKPFLTSYEWNKKYTAFSVHGEAGGQVSYIVLANRDDPSVKLVRRPVEEEKRDATKGKLLCPEAYGESAEKAIAPPPTSVDEPESEAPVSAEGYEKATIEAAQARHNAHQQEAERSEQEFLARQALREQFAKEREAIVQHRKQKELAAQSSERKPR
jgi:hypothetical protein